MSSLSSHNQLGFCLTVFILYSTSVVNEKYQLKLRTEIDSGFPDFHLGSPSIQRISIEFREVHGILGNSKECSQVYRSPAAVNFLVYNRALIRSPTTNTPFTHAHNDKQQTITGGGARPSTPPYLCAASVLLLVFGRNKYNLHDKIANTGSFCMCLCVPVRVSVSGRQMSWGRGAEASAGSLSQTKLHTKTINEQSSATTLPTKDLIAWS